MNTTTSDDVRITCFFYSHAWAIQVLDRVGVGSLADTLVVEVSINSILSSVFNEVENNRRGAAGLLRNGVTVNDIMQRFSGLPCPIVLASRPPVPVAATAAGVGVLRHATHEFKRVILLVHLTEAALMAPALSEADEFGVLWDIADVPTLALADLGSILMRNDCLSDDSWAGLHFYEHPRRTVPDAAARRQRYQDIFAEFPALHRATS